MLYKPFGKLPDSVLVNNKSYKINTDFRVWLEISEYLNDENKDIYEKLIFVLIKGYSDTLPEHMDEAVCALADFCNMGSNKKSGKEKNVIIDFKNDEGLIYAAFMQQYKIDLYKENLHWWKFLYLFNALDNNTMLVKIMGYRCMDCSKIKDARMRNYYLNLKNRYKLENDLSDSDVAQILSNI